MSGLLVFAILLCITPYSCLARTAPSDEKPNIVIFFADDVSYNIDCQLMGSQEMTIFIAMA